jgi:hypothetical protein
VRQPRPARRSISLLRAPRWTGKTAAIRTRSSCTRLPPQVSSTSAQMPRNAVRLTVALCVCRRSAGAPTWADARMRRVVAMIAEAVNGEGETFNRRSIPLECGPHDPNLWQEWTLFQSEKEWIRDQIGGWHAYEGPKWDDADFMSRAYSVSQDYWVGRDFWTNAAIDGVCFGIQPHVACPTHFPWVSDIRVVRSAVGGDLCHLARDRVPLWVERRWYESARRTTTP